jgi:hypothetical protein
LATWPIEYWKVVVEGHVNVRALQHARAKRNLTEVFKVQNKKSYGFNHLMQFANSHHRCLPVIVCESGQVGLSFSLSVLTAGHHPKR